MSNTTRPVTKNSKAPYLKNCPILTSEEAANVNLNIKPEEVAKCIEEIGIGFMFAPNFHPGMKYVMPARKRIADKTIFNLLGPLTNPANAKRQSLGVYDSKWIIPVAET